MHPVEGLAALDLLKALAGNTDLIQRPEGGRPFELVSEFEPAGDQPQAIVELVEGLRRQERDQVLLGVTGSGKTFTMAHVIAQMQRPAIVLAPNKILAAQLYGEFKSFFPNNAVEYFVSYYDYYQPEAYVPRTDTYIEKTSSINEQIDRMRHSATRALFERDDVVIVASVSCIYGIGSPETYARMTLTLKQGQKVERQRLLRALVELQYRRNELDFSRGAFRAKGDTIEIFPAHLEDRAWRLSMFGDEVESITEFDPLTGERTGRLDQIRLYPNSHYVTPRPTLQEAVKSIKEELAERLAWYRDTGKLLEAERIEQRTVADMEMIMTTGSCPGIENYSRYLTGRAPGEPPPTLFEYIPENAILFVDESHVAVPQVGGMYKGDYQRKSTLAEFGFRLPSCIDNRPLKFDEWDVMRPQTVFVSATPAGWELERTGGVFVEQVIRPTGLIDPDLRHPPGRAPGRRPPGRVPRLPRAGPARAGDHAHQAHGRGPVGVPARAGRARALPALGHRHARAHRDRPRPAAGQVRRAGRHQPAARGPGHPRMRAGGDPGRRQGGLSALRDLADPDHRPRRAQRRGPGHPLRRHRDPEPQGRHRRDRPPARQAGGLERGARDHAADDQAPDQRHHPLGGRARLHHGRPRRRRAGAHSPAWTCTPISASSRRRCARPRPTSSSRRRRACATRSGSSRTRSWASPPPARARRRAPAGAAWKPTSGSRDDKRRAAQAKAKSRRRAGP